MKKNNNKISQHKIKRAAKNTARKAALKNEEKTYIKHVADTRKVSLDYARFLINSGAIYMAKKIKGGE